MEKEQVSGLFMEQEIKDFFCIKTLNNKDFRDPFLQDTCTGLTTSLPGVLCKYWQVIHRL